LPVTEWPTTATLPNGAPGNHYIFAEVQAAVMVDSALDSSPTGSSELRPARTRSRLIAVDPSSGQTVRGGRAFIGGRTYAGTARARRPSCAAEVIPTTKTGWCPGSPTRSTWDGDRA